MTTGPVLAAILAAVAIGAGLVRAWLTRRALAKATTRAINAEAERDAAIGTAAAATRAGELAAEQRHADRAADKAAEVIEHAPTTGDPVADLRAIDRAARELHAARGEGADGGDRRAPAVPPRR